MEPETQSVDPADALLAAFEAETEAGEQRSAEFSRRPQPEDDAALDEPVEADGEAEAEAGEPEEAEAAEADDAPEGDYVEHEGQKISVGDLLAAHKFKQETEAQLTQLRHQVIESGRAEVEQTRQTWRKNLEVLNQAYEYIQSVAPPLERPPTDMLDPNSPNYNPDGYHWWQRQYEEHSSRRTQAARAMEQMRAEAEREAQEARSALVQQNIATLRSKFPAFGQKEAGELAGFLKAQYGFDDETITSVIDHRFFELAMDAQAFRAAKAKGAPKPAEAAKAGPRLVRSAPKAAPKAGQTRRKADALKQLKSTGKVTDREAIFGDFIT